MKEYPEKVRVVYKMHPLENHPFAQIAAQAALAAQEQGKFLEMHNLLMGRQATFFKLAQEKANTLSLPPEKATSPEVQEAVFGDLAREVGLDMDRFARGLKSEANKARISTETREVVSIGAGGTPASFVNGRFVSGAVPYEQFQKVVDEVLKAETTAKAGSP